MFIGYVQRGSQTFWKSGSNIYQDRDKSQVIIAVTDGYSWTDHWTQMVPNAAFKKIIQELRCQTST